MSCTKLTALALHCVGDCMQVGPWCNENISTRPEGGKAETVTHNHEDFTTGEFLEH